MTYSGSGRFRTMSLTIILPPVCSTRNTSRKTCGLSVERLMTQLEITTSTEASSTGRASIVPSRNSTFARPVVAKNLTAFLRARAEHLRRHVHADGAARVAHLLGRQEHVLARAAAQVQHHVAGGDVRKRQRVAAGEAQFGLRHRMVGDDVGGVVAARLRAAASGRLAGHLGVGLTDNLAGVFASLMARPPLNLLWHSRPRLCGTGGGRATSRPPRRGTISASATG